MYVKLAVDCKQQKRFKKSKSLYIEKITPLVFSYNLIDNPKVKMIRIQAQR